LPFLPEAASHHQEMMALCSNIGGGFTILSLWKQDYKRLEGICKASELIELIAKSFR
jgi:hypothetical protein